MKDAKTHADYKARFETLQARFIDEPKEAVREATNLVREAVDSLFHGEQDTERLRRLMQGYRDLLGRLDGRETVAATPATGDLGSQPTAGEREGVPDEETAEPRASRSE